MTARAHATIAVSLGAALFAGCTTTSPNKAQLGFTADDRKVFKEAEAKFDDPKAPKDMKPAESFLTMGQFYLEAKRSTIAVRMFEKAIEADPKLVASYAGLAKCHSEEGRIDQAAAALDKGFVIDPKSPVLWNEAAVLRAKTGDMEGAVDAAQRAASLAPGVNLYAENLGNLLTVCGRFEQAIDVYSKSLGASEAHYRIGLVLTNKGDRRKGQDHLKQALALNPDHASARRVLAAMEGTPVADATVQQAGYQAAELETQPVQQSQQPRRSSRPTAPQWAPR